MDLLAGVEDLAGGRKKVPTHLSRYTARRTAARNRSSAAADNTPTVRRTTTSLAVTMRCGKTKLPCGNGPPTAKSVATNGKASGWPCDLLVTWQSSTSSRLKTANTTAGRSLLLAKMLERKRHQHDGSGYKAAHAASSSGVDQSSAHADCAVGSRFSRSCGTWVARRRRKAKKSSTSCCTASGAALNSNCSCSVTLTILPPDRRARRFGKYTLGLSAVQTQICRRSAGIFAAGGDKIIDPGRAEVSSA